MFLLVLLLYWLFVLMMVLRWDIMLGKRDGVWEPQLCVSHGLYLCQDPQEDEMIHLKGLPCNEISNVYTNSPMTVWTDLVLITVIYSCAVPLRQQIKKPLDQLSVVVRNLKIAGHLDSGLCFSSKVNTSGDLLERSTWCLCVRLRSIVSGGASRQIWTVWMQCMKDLETTK